MNDSKKLGIIDGKFYPCPPYPNCVSTQSSDDMHKIEPIAYNTSRIDAMEKIITIIKSSKRTKIVTQTDDYIHVEFKSRLLKFIDDVEFYFSQEQKVIHFRSVSRIGHNDWGVNRKRMELIRNKFTMD